MKLSYRKCLLFKLLVLIFLCLTRFMKLCDCVFVLSEFPDIFFISFFAFLGFERFGL